MKGKHDSAGRPAKPAGGFGSTGPGAAAEPDRTFLLECRLEQLRSALAEARADADRARDRVAEAAAREADQALRHGAVHEELAQAREEIASLHRRLEHSEALRAEVEGRLFESGARDDTAELMRLRREVLAERQRCASYETTVGDLRARVDELIASRETLLARVVEWQRSVRLGDTESIDLAEFISALRREILELEHRSVMGERREAGLREQLELAGGDTLTRPPRPQASKSIEPTADAPALAGPRPLPPEPMPSAAGPADDLVAALHTAEGSASQIAALLRIGRSGDHTVFAAVRPWGTAPDPLVRAAAYEAMGRLLEGDPSRLEDHVRQGLGDSDPRVRRRVVLAVATTRGLALRELLGPLTEDPDPQVRRIVHQVLRNTAETGSERGEGGSGIETRRASTARAPGESSVVTSRRSRARGA